MPFDAFVHAVAAIPDHDADEHLRSQHSFFTAGNQAVAADFIGRYENLPADFDAVERRLGLPLHGLPRLQATHPHQPYANSYTPALRDLAAERYHRDIETFHYRFPV
jgi:hypothetical protein